MVARRSDDFPELDEAELSSYDPFGYESTPSGTFNDPARAVTFSKAELDFRDMTTNRRRATEFARWSRECRTRASERSPPKVKREPVQRAKKPAAPPKYTKKWPGVIDEQG